MVRERSVIAGYFGCVIENFRQVVLLTEVFFFQAKLDRNIFVLYANPFF